MLNEDWMMIEDITMMEVLFFCGCDMPE